MRIWILGKAAKEIFDAFVVFAGSHPEIIITPVNMNEDVTKMYNHVVDQNY